MDHNDSACADYAYNTLLSLPHISDELINELIYRCSIDPSIVASAGHENFGEPSIILGDANGWIAEIISWDTMVTSIHEHSNFGAFKTLNGSRIHFTFIFLEKKHINLDSTIKLGSLECASIEELPPGTTTKVLKRSDFIHSIWPISGRATTFVLRKKGPNDSWGYFPKSICYDVRLAENYINERIRYLKDLRRYSEKLYSDSLVRIFLTAPMAASVHLITSLGISKKDHFFTDLISASTERSEELARCLIETSEIDSFFGTIFLMRAKALYPEHQRALAFTFYSKFIPDIPKDTFIAIGSPKTSGSIASQGDYL